MTTDLSDVLQVLQNLFLILFVVGSMLAMGLGLTLGQILTPLKNARFVVLALVANFVVVPALGWTISEILGLDDSLATGLVIVAVVAGAPFLPKLVQMAKADVASGVALMVLLMVVTIAYAPIMIPILISGASVSAWDIARPLIVLMLAPLAVGLFVKARWDTVADGVKAIAAQVANLGLAALLVLVVALNFEAVLSLIGTRGILAAVLFVAGAFIIGWLLAARERSAHAVMGLGTAQRNLSAAMTIAAANFATDPDVMVMIVVTAILMLVMLLGTGGELGKRASAPAEAPSDV